jgi:glyoxylase-like metal-dependent hydrolase (beta-lactamase superfamily II)
MIIIPLSEGAFTIDASKQFVPFDANIDNLQQRPVGSLLVEIQPFAIITNTDVIVCDTGLGFIENNQLQIHKNLLQNGIPPERVTKVILSHLHKDHAGGIGYNSTNGKKEMSFENAVYYIQKAEFDYAMQTGFPSYTIDDISFLHNNNQVQWLLGDGYIAPNIEHTFTNAHSKFHQVFWIKENNQTVFFGGDDAPQIKQLKTKFIAKYDFDGRKCMQLRSNWWQEGNQNNWHFLLYHDIKTPVFTGNKANIE